MCQFYGIPTLSFSCTSQINHWTLKPLSKCNTISVTRWFKFISVSLTVKHFSSSVKNKNSFQESNANSVNDIVHLLSWFGIQNTHPLDAWDPIYEKWHKDSYFYFTLIPLEHFYTYWLLIFATLKEILNFLL